MPSRSLRPVLLSLLVLLASSAYPAIRVSGEREISARVTDLAPFDQTNAHIATDGTSFFTVWEELGSGVLGARLDAKGDVVDTMPLVVASGGSIPDIAWGGGHYLAVWQTPYPNRGISGRFIERDGSMGEPFLIRTRELFNGIETDLAFNGSVFLATWLDSFTRQGEIIDPSGHLLAEVAIPGTDPGADVAALAGTFYVAYPARIDPQMVPAMVTVDASGHTSAPVQIGPANQLVEKIHVAARSGDLLIAWSTSYGQELNSVVVTVAGVRDVETIPVPYKWLENVVVDGFGYLLVYGDDHQKLFRRAGIPAAPPLNIAAPAYTIMVDTATSNARTVSILRRNNQYDNLGGDLYVHEFFEKSVKPLATAPRHQEFPAIASAGGTKLAVWLETRPSERVRTVYARRLDANGNPLDAEPIEIGSTSSRSMTSVASNGTDWLVVWSTDSEVLGKRVAGDGTVLDAAPLKLSDAKPQSPPKVAWDGTSYVVVYTGGVKVYLAFVYATRVPASGPPSEPLRINDTFAVSNAVVAAGPNGALIVWNPFDHVAGALLSPTGTITPLTFEVPYGYLTSIAWNRDAFLVTMYDARFRTLSWMTIDATGNLVTAPPAIETATSAVYPSVSAFGENFLLFWNDPELRAAIVDRRGTILSGPAAIGPAAINPAAAADGVVLTAHTLDLPTRMVARVFVQTLEWIANARQRSVRH